ncbi:TonB-dependent receptor [Brevundimonas balnearis]|uniref:TonB-dependent receptor n=1 Tax=Brevundimonas balnearis TaxID=1572858 RepID=A0ABV6R299_9CAUL
MSVNKPEVRLSAAQRALLRGGVSLVAVAAVMAATPVLAQEADPEATEVEEIVVTGIRASLQNAQAIKQDSEVFVDSITAEDIGALPDRSVTEALQRVPGVAIDRFAAGVDPDHFSVEGSGVVVRGLTFVRSELNGRDTFTANNGRALSFADVPPELMGGVDVFKSPSADMIEGGIAGTVNLRTRVPFDAPGRVIAASAEASYGDFAEEVTPTFSALISDRWENGAGEFGIMLNAVYSQLISRGDGQQISNYGPRTLYSNGDVVATPGATAVGDVWFPRGAAFRSQEFDRERRGYAGAFQWRSHDRRWQATAQFLRSDSSQAWTEHAMEIATDNVTSNGDSQAQVGTTLDFGPDGLFTSGIITGTTGWRADQNQVDPRTPINGLQSNNIRRDVEQQAVTTDYGFNLRWTPTDRLGLSFDYQHVDSTVDVLDAGLWNSTYQNASIEIRGSDIPVVTFLPPFLDGTPCVGAPSATCPGYYRNGNDNFSSPYNTFSRAAMDHKEMSEGTLDAFRIDGEYSFDDSWVRSLRFGVRHAIRDQTTRFTSYNWGVLTEQWGDNGPVWLSDNVDGIPNAGGAPGGPGFLAADFHETYAFDNFMRGQVPVPTGAQPRLFFNQNIIDNYDVYSAYGLAVGDEWRARLNAAGCQQNWVPLALRCNADADGFLPQEINPVEEETSAAYFMVRYGHEFANGWNLSGNLGLRYTKTDRAAEGFQAFNLGSFPTEATCAEPVPPGQEPSPFCGLAPEVRAQARAYADGAITPFTAETDFDYWLPSFNAKLEVGNGLQFRLGLSRTITPPDIGLTRAYYNISLSTLAQDIIDGRPTGRFTVGNPYLRPISADNLDLSAEWYFDDVGQLTLSLFYKELNDVITNGTERLAFTNNGATFDAVVTTPVNSEDQGTIRGFEIAYQQTYDFLPAPFDGLGLSANYTFIDSEGVAQSTLSSTDPDVAAGRVANIDTSLLPLQNLSEHTVNVATFYEKGPWSARLAYAWRSEFLITPRDVIVPYAPIMNEDTGQLDGSFFYTLNENWKIGVQAVNLTNEITRTSQILNNDLLRAPRSWFMNDRRFTLVMRATF